MHIQNGYVGCRPTKVSVSCSAACLSQYMIFKLFEWANFLVAGAEHDLYEHNLIPKGLAVVLLYAERKA